MCFWESCRTGCGNRETPRFRTLFSLGGLEGMVEGAESPVLLTLRVNKNGASPRSREDQEMSVPPGKRQLVMIQPHSLVSL